jgi:transcriptional regulator with XRE-family HTH domain
MLATRSLSGATLPVGIQARQYPEVIYLAVHDLNNAAMEREEHWRQRLLELKGGLELKQSQIAADIGVADSYVSRLLYPPGKRGRKNLGLDNLRRLCAAYALPPDWFDLPLGARVPGAGSSMLVSESAAVFALRRDAWPFNLVTQDRIAKLRKALGPKLSDEAISDLDESLDLAVTKWERRAAQRKRRRSS